MTNRTDRLRRLLNPRSIVFVGGGAVEPAIIYTRKLGFSGSLYAINPRRDQIAGAPCFSSAAALPEKPDAAFVLVPVDKAIDAVRDLAAAGVGAAIVCTSGFAEFGRGDLQASLIEAAADMPFLGPNSPGYSNFLDGVSAMLDNMGMTLCKQGVAVVSNGGAYMTDMACADRSLPIAMIIGLGNQAEVSAADMVDAVLEDDRITAINLYFESVKDVARLCEVAEKARLKGIPIVALKVGQTKAGARAAATHTAAMSTDAVVISALFRRLGFIEVESHSEAMETLKMLSIARLPKGRRVGFATSSGSYAAMGADLTERVGLELPELEAERRSVLQPLMEPFVTPNNPLDLATAQFWPDDDQRRLFDAFLAGGFDIALQCMSFPPENTWEDESWYRSARIFAESAKAADLPAVFVSSIHEGLPKRAREMLIDLGVAPLQGFDDGILAIAHAVRYAERHAQGFEITRLPEPTAELGEMKTVDEAEAKTLLRQAGIAAPKGMIWQSEEAPNGVDYPAALKICDEKLLHKSDVDGVSLNIGSPDELLKARQSMRAAARLHGSDSDRFLVESMIENGVGELLIGFRQVPMIGLTLTVATGGVAAEIFDDAATLLLPATRPEAESALKSLALFPLLNGWRGRTRADVDASIDTIARLCDFVEARRDTLIELEINPLILLPEGQGACVADAVMRFTE